MLTHPGDDIMAVTLQTAHLNSFVWMKLPHVISSSFKDVRLEALCDERQWWKVQRNEKCFNESSIILLKYRLQNASRLVWRKRIKWKYNIARNITYCYSCYKVSVFIYITHYKTAYTAKEVKLKQYYSQSSEKHIIRTCINCRTVIRRRKHSRAMLSLSATFALKRVPKIWAKISAFLYSGQRYSINVDKCVLCYPYSIGIYVNRFVQT